MNKPKRKFGDRYDGYLIRNCDPLFQIIPFVMRTRTDSMVYFDSEIEITELEKFVREHRRDDIPNLRTLYVYMAAMVRLMSQMPHLNRFVAGRKIYAHNDMRISLAAKRSMSVESEETTIMPCFEPEDTLYDVVEKVESILQSEVFEAKNDNGGTYMVAKAIGVIPTVIKTIFVDFVRFLDSVGLMPKAIHRASPFHCSMFITDLGSCGIGPIFHHLYEFGTCSVFLAIGKKETRYEPDADGNVQARRYMGLKVVADERICDGFYYATAMKKLARILKHPEVLLTPPDEVVEDTHIRRPSRKDKAAASAVADDVKEPVTVE